jgi:hypothetical protein
MALRSRFLVVGILRGVPLALETPCGAFAYAMARDLYEIEAAEA